MSKRLLISISALMVSAVLVAGFAVKRNSGRVRGIDADTIPLASQARRECEAVGAAERQGCYERILVGLVDTRGVRVAMGTLNALATEDRSIKDEGHVYAHAIGITAGRGGSEVSQQFAACTEILQSGCYHGVIQGYFERISAVDTANVNALCRPFASGNTQWLNFQCAHGLGHGLMMVYRHDLPVALGGCDMLLDSWSRESCYGGAFMENIVNATVPHHPASRLAAAADSAKAQQQASGGHSHGGAHEGHGSATTANPTFKALDSTDMHYPCSIMASRYLTQCYMMQTSIVMRYTGGNVDSSAAVCLGAPGAMRYVCAQSLGRDIVSWSHDDHALSRERCEKVADEFEPWCHIGVAKNLIDLTAKPQDGMSYCAELNGEPNKLKCYEAVGEQIATLYADVTQRRTSCATAGSFIQACEFGAQVTTRRPQGLPMQRS